MVLPPSVSRWKASAARLPPLIDALHSSKMNVIYRGIRGVPDQSVLPQRAIAAEVTDHHQTGRDADAHRERFRNGPLKPRNRGNDIERRPHRSLGIVFVRAGIAEIRQYSIAPEITEEAVIVLHDTGAGGVIGIHHSTHVLRIESGR